MYKVKEFDENQFKEFLEKCLPIYLGIKEGK